MSQKQGAWSLWLEAERRWEWTIGLWTTALAAKKEWFSSSHLRGDRWWNVDSFQKSKGGNKIVRTAWACFNIVALAEYSHCKGFTVYLVGPRRWYLFSASEAKWNYFYGEVSNATDVIEPNTAQNAAPVRKRNENVILQRDNARTHIAKPVKSSLKVLNLEFLPHPPYSHHSVPSDYYLFRSMEHGLVNNPFHSYEDIAKWLDSWITSKDEQILRDGVRPLPEKNENTSSLAVNDI